MRTFRSAIAALSVFGLMAGSAQAATVTYYLDQSNADPLLPDGWVNYVSVTITDGVTFGLDTDAVQFDVTILAPLLSIAGTGSFGLDGFGFNSDLTLADSAIVGMPAGWSANAAPPPNTLDGFGMFTVGLNDSGNPQNPTLTFYVSGVSGDTIANYYFLSTGGQTQGYSHFTAHVRGFVDQDPSFCDVNGDLQEDPECITTSAWFGDGDGFTVVPVPAAVWLFGSAIGLLGFVRRRIGQ